MSSLDYFYGVFATLAAGAFVGAVVAGASRDALGRGALAGFGVVYALLALAFFIRGSASAAGKDAPDG